MKRAKNQYALAATLHVLVSVIFTAIFALFFATSFIGASSKTGRVNSKPESAATSANPGSEIEPLRLSQLGGISLADRVAYQYAIEDVYWRHRIWPNGNGRPKPPLDEVMSSTQMRQKVERVLCDSQMLAAKGRAITPEQLQGEMERIASQTKQAGVLRELFDALQNDPRLIAECLVRPILSATLVSELDAGGKVETDSELSTYSNEGTTAVYTLPIITAPATSCTDDTWTLVSSTNAPSDRSDHATVWTGSEMIVWGGSSLGPSNTGGRYNPSTDSWVATTTTNAPVGRYLHTAVWTGTEMIVWGGSNNGTYVNSGGRYNPITDSWVATTMNGAPTARQDHVAVWSGSKMIVWGGRDSSDVVDSGGRYDPNIDNWDPTTIVDAPIPREYFTAVWSGSEMIVWGGWPNGGLNTGGRYNPNTDSWVATTTTGAPTRRYYHTAFWTGSEMIVWGGYVYNSGPANTGGRYDPVTDSWIAISTINGPVGRYSHTAVWSGEEMIIWGGYSTFGPLNSGGRYNLSVDYWANLTNNNAPAPRYLHTGVWTGNEMIVWGGSASGGGKYCAQKPPPTPTPCAPCPPTPSPTRAPVPSPTPFEGFGVLYWEGFDHTAVPALPSGWHSTFTPGAADCTGAGTCAFGTNWATSTSNPSSGAVCAFHDAPACVSDSVLDTPSIHIPNLNYTYVSLSFRSNYNLENGRDGGVLELSINGGPFTDVGLGYNGTISTGFLSPIAGRQAWTGNSGGYIYTGIDIPGAAWGQNVVFRFRLATDCSGSGAGWSIDEVFISYRVPYPPQQSPTPSPIPTLTPTPTPAPTPTPRAQALNLSTRLLVGTGNDVGIGGFIITGTSPKRMLLRGIGPSLGGAGVANPLADPTLELRDDTGALIAANDDWCRPTPTPPDDQCSPEIIATGVAPSDPVESALVTTLSPGAYTAILAGKNNQSGVALVELYDLDPAATSKLSNLSTRGFVDNGDETVIAGFILGTATGDDKIVLRGLGPSLAVPNPLANPRLELRDSAGVLVASDEDWMDDPNQAAEIAELGLAPTDSLEAAMVVDLPPAAYTALLRGSNNATGIGLVEVYDQVSLPTPTPSPTPIRFEAENAILTGCYDQIDSQASNGYRVDGIDVIGDSVKFTQVPAATHLVFRYATPNTGHMSLYVNDIFSVQVEFAATPGGWVYPFVDKEVVLNIAEGSSVTLQFDSGDVAINLDYVEIYQ